MNEKITFEIPEGYVIDKENSTDTKLVYKLKKEEEEVVKTYDDVMRKLFFTKQSYSIYERDRIYSYTPFTTYYTFDNCTSEKHAKKLLALSKLMNVAKYVNHIYPKEGDFYIFLAHNGDRYHIIPHKINGFNNFPHLGILFNSQEAIEKSVEILGLETIKEALTTDF